MKICIAYASAGRGHRAAAEALYAHLKTNYPQYETELIDALSYTNVLFKFIYANGYYFIGSHLWFVWSFFYFISFNKCVRLVFNAWSRFNSRKMIAYLKTKRPDVVLSTHFLPSDIAASLKRQSKLHTRLVTVITDFGVHPMWLSPQTDDYIVAGEHTAFRLLAYGIPKGKIKALGIPVRDDFLDTSPAREPGLRALLVMGSFGLRFVEKIAELLFSDIGLTVVCGKNKRLYERLARKQYPGVALFGFTDRMPQIMSSVDFVITKPGGLTIAEALASDLPMVFTSGIPGQETENAGILEAAGCAIVSGGIEEIRRICLAFKSDRGKLAVLRDNIQKVKKPHATKEICEYVCKGFTGAAG